LNTRKIRTYHEVAAPDAERDVIGQVSEQVERLNARLATVKRIIVIGSGKGGVGKSAVTANLAAALAARGLAVGALDADLNGPTLARMLGVSTTQLRVEEGAITPPRGVAGVRVMSMDLLLASEDALRWRNNGQQPPDPATGAPGFTPPEFLWQSTLEAGTLREFLADVAWGSLDALLIDAPPGTDKLVRLFQLLPRIDLALLVSTPGEAARFVVAKSIHLAQEASAAARLGLIANMTSHVCEACGHVTPLFERNAVGDLAKDTGIEVWAEVPFDGRLATSTDAGRPFVLDTPLAPAALSLRKLAIRIAQETA
jgi:ATP-binding protein involved in chromosome partitioning